MDVIPKDLRNIIYQYAKPHFDTYIFLPKHIYDRIEKRNPDCIDYICALYIYNNKIYRLECNNDKHRHIPVRLYDRLLGFREILSWQNNDYLNIKEQYDYDYIRDFYEPIKYWFFIIHRYFYPYLILPYVVTLFCTEMYQYNRILDINNIIKIYFFIFALLSISLGIFDYFVEFGYANIPYNFWGPFIRPFLPYSCIGGVILTLINV